MIRKVELQKAIQEEAIRAAGDYLSPDELFNVLEFASRLNIYVSSFDRMTSNFHFNDGEIYSLDAIAYYIQENKQSPSKHG